MRDSVNTALARTSRSAVLRWRALPGGAALLCVALLASSPVAADGEGARQRFPVKVGNRTIVVLHGPLAGHTAEERARRAMERIGSALEAEAHPPVTFGKVTEVEATRVLLGGQHAFL